MRGSGERGFEGIYNLFNNSGRSCGIIEMREIGGGVEKGGATLTIVMWGKRNN